MVLDRLVMHKWVVDPKKCKFFVKTVDFCGNQISEGVRRPALGRMVPLAKWEIPKTISALRVFFGFY